MLSRRTVVAVGAITAAVTAAVSLPAHATDKPRDPTMTALFKIITVKDDIVVGLSAEELAGLGGEDAGAIGRALASKGELTVWQYTVKKAANGDLQQTPLRKVALLAHASLRVEPYKTPLAVLPHD